MVQWWKRTGERPRGGLYDAMPVHPGPGATKMQWVWVQAVADCLDGYAKVWLRLGGHINATWWSESTREPRDTGTTLLMAACFGSSWSGSDGERTRVEIVDLLLCHGAAVNMQDNNGYTALHHLMERHKALVEDGMPSAQTFATIKRLLQAGADPQLPTSYMAHTA